MATKDNIQKAIKDNINSNGNNGITGQILQDVLLQMTEQESDTEYIAGENISISNEKVISTNNSELITSFPVLNSEEMLVVDPVNKSFVSNPRRYDENGNIENNNAAFGNYSSAFGFDCKIFTNGANSFIAGDSSTINSEDSFVFGKNCHVVEDSSNSFVTGINNTVNRKNSFLIGEGLKSCDENCLVIGQYNTPLNFGNDKTLFVVGQGSSDSARQNIFLIQKGKAACRGNVDSGQSWIGDFAEYFEWADGNPDNEDRVGYMVQLNGEKIEKATDFTSCIGVVSSTYSFVSGSCLFEWKGKYLKDDFGRELKDENNNLILNPEYNQKLEYTPREYRKEWSPVGLIGQILTRQDGTLTVGGYAGCDNGVATNSTDGGYRVLKIINENVALLLIK